MRACILLVAAVGAVCLAACSGDGGDEKGDEGTGSSSSGGAFGSGGNAESGGAASSGGHAESGGGPSSGGGSPGSGGTSSSGGSPASGGNTPVGGGDGSGGDPGGLVALPSAGCESSATPQEGVLEISVGALLRSYILSLPENYDPSVPYPVVFAFHGLGGSGQLVSGPFYFGLEQVDAVPTIFVYPDGLEVQNGGGAGWDNQGGRDVEFFDAILESLTVQACIDENRVFATGHSYGGIMTHTLACQRADVLRAVAPVAGARFSGGTCGAAVAAWGTHGTNDETVDYSAGLSAIERIMDTNGCEQMNATPVAPSEYCSRYACDEGVPVVWCPHQQEHDWPDFASEAILDFFQQF